MNAMTHVLPTEQTTNVLEVAIIGAGLSGVGMAIQLKQAGVDQVRIFEKADAVGGTWRDNTYPGCGCDVESQLYSFSFEPNPDWTRTFARAAEIQAYVEHCTDKYGIRSQITFNTEIVDARFIDAAGHWQLTTGQGEVVLARHMVMAIGPFKGASVPDIPGMDRFLGKIQHTAYWDHQVDYRGQRVGLIGTGASAIQVGPALATEAAQLTVFQRTPAWILPKNDKHIPDWRKRLNRRVPLLMKADRLKSYWYHELSAPFLILEHEAFKRIPEALAKAYLYRLVKSPELREKLTPNYRFGCKRALISSAWYPMMQQPNVHLCTDGIREITPHGVMTSDGREHVLDMLVLATGYKVPLAEAPFPIFGLTGQSLNDRAQNGAEAYKGLAIAGYPNMYFLMGPWSGPGHQSVTVYQEAQFDYITQAIRYRIDQSAHHVTVKEGIEQDFVQEMDWRSQFTVWTSGCASWYLSPNGRNNALFPGYHLEYKFRVRRFKPSDYVVTSHVPLAEPTSSAMAVEQTLS